MKFKDNDFIKVVDDIITNDTVQSLKMFTHHYGSNRFEHSLSVAYNSYLICKFLNLDYISIARAGLLHDLFLYDCENKSNRPKFHIWKHPKVALSNSKKLFNLNKKECDIILKHMWPITIIPPKYPESFIITFVDKYCAFKEWSNYCKTVLFYIYLISFSKVSHYIFNIA